jgi:hypothetical protein
MGIVIVFYLQSLMFNIIGIFKSYQFNRFYYFTHFFYPICGVFAFKHIPNYINIATIKDIPARKFLIIISFFIIGYDSIIFKIHNLTRWAVGYNYAYQYNSNQLKELAKKEIIKNNYFRVGTISSPHGLLQPGHANAYGFETVDGYFNMQSQRYQEFWLKILADEEWHPRIKTWGNRLYLYRPGGTNNSKYVNYKPIVFKDYYRLNLLSLANTKYILSLKQKPIDPNLVCLYKPSIVHRITSQIERVLFKLKQTFTTGMTLYICENKTVLPRFFVTNKINIYNTSKTLLNELAFAKVDTLKNTVFIEKQFLKNINYHNIGFKTYKMEITKYTPDLINLTVELDGNGMLIVTNSYSPFWKVKVNGIETKILPAYHTFWGVYIKKGINEIIFNYDPPYRNL